MANKRSRVRYCDDNEEDDKYVPKKQLKITVKSDEILLAVKTFKQEIINYNKAINRIKYSLDNPEEFIYDDCSELKRSVQLETEEIIADIKQSNQIDPDLDENKLELEIFNLIQNVIDQSQAIINSIDDHEKMSKSYWIGKGIDKKLFNKDYNKLKQFSDLFIQNWTNRLDELKFEDKTMTEAADKLREYQGKIKYLTILIALI